MTIIAKSVGFLLLATMLHFVSCSRSPVKAPATTSRFQAGQVWSFHTPTNELSGATLTIVRVDIDRELGPVIYTSLSGVRHATWETHMFLPFSQDALDRSVIAVLREDVQLSKDDAETFEEFYSQHHQGIESGQSGKCFTITVAEVIDAKRKRDLKE